MTLIEVSVSAGILLLLFGSIILIYKSSASVWRTVDIRTGLLRELQVAVRYLERGLELTHSYGLARSENAIAYVSATDENDDIEIDDNGEPVGQKFVLVYVGPNGRLRRRMLPLPSPHSAVPISFEEAHGSALQYYLTGPRARDRYLTSSGNIKELKLENSGEYGSLFELTVKAEQKKSSQETETLEIKTKVSIRN